MATESAAVGKVRLYLEAAGLVDRDTFSKVPCSLCICQLHT
jgi:hypothetical protein